jgi:hypothetical protein
MMADEWGMESWQYAPDVQYNSNGQMVRPVAAQQAPIDRTQDFLRSFAYTQGGAGGSGELKRFLDGLVAKGFTGDDFINGLEKYNQMQGMGYARPNDADYPGDSFYKYNGNENVGWWGEQERIKAIGAGLDALGKPTGWQSQYNPNLAQQQQQRVGQIGTEAQNSDRNDSDLMDVLKFAGAAAGMYGLGGLLSGAGAAGGAGASSAGLGNLGSGTFGLDLAGLGGTATGAGASTGLGSLGIGATGSGLTAAGGGTLGSGLAGLGAADLASVGLGGLASAGGAAAGVGNLGAGDVIASGTGGGSGGGNTVGDWDFLDLLDGGSSGAADTGLSAADAISQAAQAGSEFGTTSAGGPLANGWQGQLANALSGIPNLPSGVSQAIKALSGGTGAAAGSGGSALSRLFGGSGTGSDWLSLLGNLGTGALSAASANKYADNMKELADRSWNAGSDYRNRLAQTYTNPGAYLDSPEVKAITDRATNSLARSLSARDGNPIGSGRALTEIQDYGAQTMLGQLGNYRQQLGNFGGQSQLSGNYGQLGSQSAEAGSNIYNSLASTANRLTQPQTDWQSIMRQFGNSLA